MLQISNRRISDSLLVRTLEKGIVAAFLLLHVQSEHELACPFLLGSRHLHPPVQCTTGDTCPRLRVDLRVNKVASQLAQSDRQSVITCKWTCSKVRFGAGTSRSNMTKGTSGCTCRQRIIRAVTNMRSRTDAAHPVRGAGLLAGQIRFQDTTHSFHMATSILDRSRIASSRSS